MRHAKAQRGITLTEILIAAVLLAMCAVPVIGVFITGKGNIVRTDDRRRARQFVREIFARLNRTSLHFLWNHFGPPNYNVPGFGPSGKFRDRLAEFDPTTGKLFPSSDPEKVNPLGFTEEFLQDMTQAGISGEIQFEFFSRKGLLIGDDPNNPIGKPHEKIGILHMQAGWARVRLVDTKTDAIVAEEYENIMCPAIVGRPGIKLSSCPAINPDVNNQYRDILAQREAQLGNPPPW